MTEASRFLELAAYELIRQEGLRIVKASGGQEGLPAWVPGWEEWDQVLVGEGPGVQPAIFAFRSGAGMDAGSIQQLFGQLVQQIATNALVQRSGSGASVRIAAVLCFDSIDPSRARNIARIVPDRYYAGIKPQVWVVDLSRGKLWATRAFGIIPSRSQEAVKRAIHEVKQGTGHGRVDLIHAESSVASQRAQFVTRVRQNVPYVTYVLLIAIVGIFALEWLSFSAGRSVDLLSSRDIGGNTLLRFGALQPRLVERGEYWRLFTAMFVHVNVLHILFNSIALYSVGSLVERIYGHIRYAVIYFVSGILGSVASYVYLVETGHLGDIAAGASGAIFGIAGVVIVLGILPQSIVPRAVALQLSVFMLVLIVLNIAFDVFTPQIDYRAHIAGLVVGIILGYLLAPRASSGSPAGLQPTETGALG